MTESLRPAKLHARLRAVHQRGQVLSFLTGLMVLSAWIIVLFLACFAVDWLAHLPSVIRSMVLPLLLGYSLYKGWSTGWRFFRSFSMSQSALKVEEHYKNMESLLVSGVQLGKQTLALGTSSLLSQLTVKKADEVAAGLKPAAVVPFSGLRRPAARAIVLCAVIAAIALINMPLLMAGLTRIFMPWQTTSYPTNTTIELARDEIVVKEGDPVLISATISGEIPEAAELALRTGKGKPHKRALEIVEGTCEYKVASAFRSFDYSINAGDAESDWQTVRVISAPRVASTQIRLVYPKYMNRPAQLMEAMTLTVPEGARIEWDLQLDTAISSAGFSIDDGEAVTLEVSDDGLTVRHKMDANASGAYAFSWVEREHNFSFKTAKHYLQVAPDQAPQIEMTSPRGNLFATLGRKLTLGYRARDDHGIGDSKIVYRRGNAAEKLIPFAAKMSEGRAIQEIDWDYRNAIKELDVGESVSFAIEVSDMYPSAAGPHLVRSESKRVSFLSKEDYLEKIREMKERLLSQLRSVYRQERAAYDVIKNLDPKDDAFEQTCFLESARQDILVERITLLNDGINDLIDDLTANNITDKSEFAGLTELRASLADISENHISKASAKLRDLGPSVNSSAEDVARTALAINNAARELSSLVLQLGVHEAMEVFAMELHVIAQSQSALRLKTIEAKVKGDALSAKQRELSQWVDRLLTELMGDRDYSKSPLAIVRLARMVKDLRAAGIEAAMEKVAVSLDRGDLTTAARMQKAVISEIFVLECNIRVGSEYEALLDARELFTAGITELDQAAIKDSGPTASDVAHRLENLHRNVRLLILPIVPAPDVELLAETPSDTPPLEDMIGTLQESLKQSVLSLKAGKGGTAQQAAAATLRQLNDVVAVRLDNVTRVARYAGQSGLAMERSGMVRELFASQMRLSEKTEDAEYDETSAAYLAPSQLHLSKEVLRMRDRIERKSKRSGSSKTVEPMLRMLEEASGAMLKAGPALADDKTILDALDHQKDAEDALKMAMSFANHEANGWIGLANLIMTAEGVAMPAKFMGDIVAEQHDLIDATKKSTPETRKELLLIQRNLALAVLDVSILLEGVGSAMDFEQAMLFAGSDMGSSVLKLEANDVPGAMRAQRLAVESVADLHKQFNAYEKQFFYFVTVMEFLQELHGDGVAALDDLGGFVRVLEGADDKDAKAQKDALNVLVRNADAFGTRMASATGSDVYFQAKVPLANAVTKLKAGARDACLDELAAAQGALNEGMHDLRELMGKVAFIPSVDPIEAPPEYEVMLDMVSLLLEQKKVGRTVYTAKDDKLPGLASGLGELDETAGELVQSTAQHKLMVGAKKAMAEAAVHLAKASGEKAYGKLHESGVMLRQCILEYALYYVEIKRPRGGKKKKKGKSSIVTMFKMSNKLKAAYDKDWGGVEGEDPESGRSEWEVLGRRDRAALNENFVRELPLEYREFLKDYYERLAK